MTEKQKLEFPEVAGKCVAEAVVLDLAPGISEVLIRFRDGTQLSINVGARHLIDTRVCVEETPDQPIALRSS